MRSTSVSQRFAALFIACALLGVGVVYASSDAPADGAVLLRSDGTAFIYKGGFKYPAPVATLSDDEIDAIQVGPSDALPQPAPAQPTSAFPPVVVAPSVSAFPHRFLPKSVHPSQNPATISKLELTSVGIERADAQHFIWHLRIANHNTETVSQYGLNSYMLGADGITKYQAFDIPQSQLAAQGSQDLPLMFTAPDAPGTRYTIYAASPAPYISVPGVVWEPFAATLP